MTSRQCLLGFIFFGKIIAICLGILKIIMEKNYLNMMIKKKIS